jgi:hypothetical protein
MKIFLKLLNLKIRCNKIYKEGMHPTSMNLIQLKLNLPKQNESQGKSIKLKIPKFASVNSSNNFSSSRRESLEKSIINRNKVILNYK